MVAAPGPGRAVSRALLFPSTALPASLRPRGARSRFSAAVARSSSRIPVSRRPRPRSRTLALVDDLDAAVDARGGIRRVEQARLAVADGFEARRVDAVVEDEIILHRLGAALGERLVVESVADRVGVAGDGEAVLGEARVLERLAEIAQHDLGVGRELVRVELEVDVEVDRGRPVAVGPLLDLDAARPQRAHARLLRIELLDDVLGFGDILSKGRRSAGGEGKHCERGEDSAHRQFSLLVSAIHAPETLRLAASAVGRTSSALRKAVRKSRSISG